MLPQKTYETKDCILYESDFDVNKTVKLRRIMEFMQDLATTHADKLGFGWNSMNDNGLFWVMSKVKIVFHKQSDRNVRRFKLYTWPVKPDRLYVERRFEAVDDQGENLFSATTVWMIVERDTRKIASREAVARFYNADFDDAPCGADVSFARIRRDCDYLLKYERTIRRSDLDLNRHVNNTNYVDYASDALADADTVSQAEITYNRELLLNDCVSVYSKQIDRVVWIVGERGGDVCFTAKLTLF